MENKEIEFVNKETETKKVDVIDSKCPSCGSELSFDPKTQNLVCRNCNYKQEINKNVENVEEYDYQTYLERYNSLKGNLPDEYEIKCSDCGATIIVNANAISTTCPFCNSNRTIKQSSTNAPINIEGVVPFNVTSDQINDLFVNWIKKRFWAPSNFKRGKKSPTYNAFYIPFWTYDSNTKSTYTAMRGDYYYVTVRVMVNGKSQTRRERRIRWTPVSGRCDINFDDVLVRGTSNILNKHVDNIKNYDLKKLNKFDEKFLLGYYAEKPSVDLEHGFADARKIMANVIQNKARNQIGGDTISNLKINTVYNNITFKQIMCPIYNGSYKFKNKTYNFLVNGQTAAISADYPKSIIKIISVISIILLLIIGIILIVYFFG